MVSNPLIQIIEDDKTIAAGLLSVVNDECEVLLSGRDPISVAQGQTRAPLLTLLALESPGNLSSEEGLRVLERLRQTGHRGKVIVYTSSPERSVAVRAVRAGAVEVLSTPLDLMLVKGIVRRALRLADLEQEARAGLVHGGYEEFKGLLGTSAGIQRIFDAIRKVSTNDVPILITGESGTGKELTAKAIHAGSLRSLGPFIPVHCGAIPELHLESELFGYEDGARTGAVGHNAGKVEVARGGTLFLDEVSDLSIPLQVKLQRCLQDRTFERVGARQPTEMNVRIIAATTVNLQEAIENGTFCEDLYDRLGVVHINVPPLRERGEDVLLIAAACLRQAASHYGNSVHGFTGEALEAMRAYPWPGNVRELSDRVRRAVLMAEGTHVGPADLDLSRQIARHDEGSISLKINQRRIETDLIMKAFTLSQGNLSRAAHELGISRSTLYRRLRQYDLDRTLDARRPLGSSTRV